MGGRLTQALVGLVAALLGASIALANVHESQEPARYAALVGAWLLAPCALLLEPAPGARVARAGWVALAASAAAAGLTLVLVTRSAPPWWRPGSDVWPLGLQLTILAWTGEPRAPWLTLTLALLPGALTLLLVRRVARQLEWQVAAAALGPAITGATLFPELATPARLWLLALTGTPVGVGAYVVDRLRLGAAGLARFPLAEARGLPRARAALLGALLASGFLWSGGLSGLASRLLPEPVEPGCPDLTPVLEDVRARQEAHRKRVGWYASSLAMLEGLAPDVAGGYTREHVLRFGFTDGTWVLTADPVPARLGWPSLRVVGPDGVIERGQRPFRLRAR